MLSNDAGFSLFEVVVSLVIIGILAAVAGLWMVTGVQGYRFAQENVVLAQKARLAVGRISKELEEIDYIDTVTTDGDAGSDSSCVIYKIKSLSKYKRAIKFDSDSSYKIYLNINPEGDCDCSCGNNEFELVDQVSAFKIGYEEPDGDEIDLANLANKNISDVGAIAIVITLDRKDGSVGAGSPDFSIRIVPRNNNILNAPGVQP